MQKLSNFLLAHPTPNLIYNTDSVDTRHWQSRQSITKIKYDSMTVMTVHIFQAELSVGNFQVTVYFLVRKHASKSFIKNVRASMGTL